jgi:hypothetical protein
MDLKQAKATTEGAFFVFRLRSCLILLDLAQIWFVF